MMLRRGLCTAVLLLGVSAWGTARGEPTLWVANSGSDSLSVLPLDASQTSSRVDTGKHPQDLVLSKDGTQLYVAEAGSNAIAIHEVNPPRFVRRIDLAPYTQPHLLQLSRDGRRVWVACGSQKAIVEAARREGAHKAWETDQAAHTCRSLPDERKLTRRTRCRERHRHRPPPASGRR
jgi:DNA-binding beta-propeller fold protein YncE